VSTTTDSAAARGRAGWLHSAYEYAALYCGVVYLGVLCLVWSPIAIVLGLVFPGTLARTVGRWAATIGFRLYLGTLALTRVCRFDLTALDALRCEAPMIIAANHPALIDAVLVISRVPATCIMKAELVRNVFLGAGARLAGYIHNDSVRQMIDRSVASLRGGAHLLVFPEGTRTTRWPVSAFVRSVGVIAKHASVPVQTVFIDIDSPYLGKGWPLFRKPSLPITYRVRLGRRFDPPAKSREFVQELERYFADELASGTMLQGWLQRRPAPDAVGR
jgi:1-acyl-sn-glycerol-3-phosphate acyltransferase